MSTVDELLKDVKESFVATQASVDLLVGAVEAESPAIVQSLLEKTGQGSLEGVSLLSLKNHALASYLNSIALITLSHLERLESDEPEHVSAAVENLVAQRVCLEKGVKPIEKKLGYQLDKMVRAYNRMEAEDAKAEEKMNNPESNDSESDDSEEEDEELSYRPDAAALAKMTAGSAPTKKSSSSSSSEKYKPPKISAMAPPSSAAGSRDKSDRSSTRKLQSMEEYLNEQSDMPSVDVSIGSTIVDHGRGGVKTLGDRKKEQEIQTYEENNFTRLPTTQTKKSFKQKQREMRNNFAGEDWSMFNNTNRDIGSDTSRKRKATSTWDRIKKKQA